MRSRFVLVGLAAAMLCAAVTSVAAAETPCKGIADGKDVCLFTEGTEKTATTFPITGKLVGSAAPLTQNGGATLVCNSGPLTGTLAAPADGVTAEKLTISFSACLIVGHTAECEVQPFTFKATGLMTTNAAIALVEEGAGPLSEVTISGGGCPFFTSKAKLTGSQTCKLVNMEVEEVAHTMTCLTNESNLKFRGSADYFQVKETLELGGKKWSIKNS
jgi:hypothetical protein